MNDEDKDSYQLMLEVLEGLKVGNCWCRLKVHTPACLEAQRVYRKLKPPIHSYTVPPLETVVRIAVIGGHDEFRLFGLHLCESYFLEPVACRGDVVIVTRGPNFLQYMRVSYEEALRGIEWYDYIKLKSADTTEIGQEFLDSIRWGKDKQASS